MKSLQVALGIWMNLCFIDMLAGACTEGRSIRSRSLPGERSVVIATVVPS